MLHEHLRSIVYTSTAARPMHHADMESLLIQARDFNRENGITGVLVYRDGMFLQCFEGEPAAVVATYERIRASRRHRGISELLNAPMAVRSFADWRMAFALPTEREMVALMDVSWGRMHQDFARDWSDAVGLSCLRRFWEAFWRDRTPQFDGV